MQYIKIKKSIIGFDRPKVCVPITAVNEKEIEEQCKIILEKAEKTTVDMVEFRGDYYEGLADNTRLKNVLTKLMKKLGDIILLFTIRSEAEGGEKLPADIVINDINEYIIENKLADIVDLEFFSGIERVEELIEKAHEKDVKIIASNHNFKTTPPTEEIINRLRGMQDVGADIVKIAVMPENKLQLMGLLTATLVMNERYADTPVVTMSMGRLGGISRVSGQVFGSAITFASVGKSSAPGQIPIDKLNETLDTIGKYCCE